MILKMPLDIKTKYELMTPKQKRKLESRAFMILSAFSSDLSRKQSQELFAIVYDYISPDAKERLNKTATEILYCNR